MLNLKNDRYFNAIQPQSYFSKVYFLLLSLYNHFFNTNLHKNNILMQYNSVLKQNMKCTLQANPHNYFSKTSQKLVKQPQTKLQESNSSSSTRGMPDPYYYFIYSLIIKSSLNEIYIKLLSHNLHYALVQIYEKFKQIKYLNKPSSS